VCGEGFYAGLCMPREHLYEVSLGRITGTGLNRRFAEFSHWTGGRRVQAIGTNHGSARIPFQDWRSFKEAFAPELIDEAVTETAIALKRPVTRLLDPFGGSGTSALAAQFLGVTPTTIEVNPYLADLIEAKIAKYDFAVLTREFGSLVSGVERRGRSGPVPLGWPTTFVEPGKDGRYLFPEALARTIASYLAEIDQVSDEASRRLFRVLLGGSLLPVSNVVVSGKGRRYRRAANASATPSAFEELFHSKVLSAIADLKQYEQRRQTDYTLLRGDSRMRVREVASQLELAVFSPPYPNSFDYTDVYNVELWVLGYLTSGRDNRILREATLRSHVQVHRDMSAARETGTILPTILSDLRSRRVDLWSRHIPEMVAAYFDDMSTVLGHIGAGLVPGGRCYQVVGDSRYAGVDIPVARILNEMAPSLGYEVLRSEPFRSMRASPQQGGRHELAETLVVWARR
jgi:hypothetical protein